MTRTKKYLTLLVLASACGSVDSADNPGTPIAVVKARLDTAPDDLGETGPLRAALVWTNGLGLVDVNTCTISSTTPQADYVACDERYRQTVSVTTSDVAVQMQFPLEVTLSLYELPTPIKHHIDDLHLGTTTAISGDFYSLPEAEVVLYEDGNHNGKLDLLPIGQPGPGPDHVVALSSGMDSAGNAIRTAIVYKAGSLPYWVPAYVPLTGTPPYDPATGWDMPENPEPELPNGLYSYRASIPHELQVLQQGMLSEHALTNSGGPGIDNAAGAIAIKPLADSRIQLFPVADDRPSWLSRGCERMLRPGFGSQQFNPVPDGAEVECGAGVLAFASNPSNYCGQTEIDVIGFNQAPPLGWPCDEHGLKPGTPYHPATARYEGDLSWQGIDLLLGYGQIQGDPEPFHCREGQIYHMDMLFQFHMPTASPKAGSEVLCHSSEAMSYIEPRGDGCRFMYRADLASDPSWPMIAPMPAWDMRQSKPAWWPCDDNGQLIPNRGLVAPKVIEHADCTGFERDILTMMPPPLGSAVRCLETPDTYEYVPPWSDACDPKQRISLHSANGGSVGSKPVWWPCDDAGHFVPSNSYVELP